LQLVEDWLAFGKLQRAACDIDPLYPVLGALTSALPDPARAAVVYVAYYNVASAFTALTTEDWTPDTLRLPTGVERRGLRGGDPMLRHLESVKAWVDAYDGSVSAWLMNGWTWQTTNPEERWQTVREQYGKAWGNGRWATYKLAEVLQKALGWPIKPPDMGMDRATGPRQCLEMFWGPAPTVLQEARGFILQQYAQDGGLRLDLAEVETVLCDFHSLAQGRYYAGHDVALLHDQVAALPEGPVKTALDQAARDTLPLAFYVPVRPELRRAYRESGALVNVAEEQGGGKQ
jgi:hypothetical protein